MTESKKSEAVVSARIPQSLKESMKTFIANSPYMNESDFVRDAIREKIQRDTPILSTEERKLLDLLKDPKVYKGIRKLIEDHEG